MTSSAQMRISLWAFVCFAAVCASAKCEALSSEHTKGNSQAIPDLSPQELRDRVRACARSANWEGIHARCTSELISDYGGDIYYMFAKVLSDHSTQGRVHFLQRSALLGSEVAIDLLIEELIGARTGSRMDGALLAAFMASKQNDACFFAGLDELKTIAERSRDPAVKEELMARLLLAIEIHLRAGVNDSVYKKWVLDLESTPIPVSKARYMERLQMLRANGAGRTCPTKGQ
jgi:hypothetical protein